MITRIAKPIRLKSVIDMEEDLRERRNKKMPTIIFKKFGFKPKYNHHNNLQIDGPLCPSKNASGGQCLALLMSDNGVSPDEVRCYVCEKKYKLPHKIDEFRKIAHLAYEGMLNSKSEIITLDVPYEAIKAESQDENRWVKVVWSQKDGRNQAVVYLIQKDQNGDKSQIFADLDREEIRYDPGDIPPGKIVTKVAVEFPKSKVVIKYKKN